MEAFEEAMESSAAIKLLQGLQDVEDGKIKPAREALSSLREKYGL